MNIRKYLQEGLSWVYTSQTVHNLSKTDPLYVELMIFWNGAQYNPTEARYDPVIWAPNKRGKQYNVKSNRNELDSNRSLAFHLPNGFPDNDQIRDTMPMLYRRLILLKIRVMRNVCYEILLWEVP